MEKELRRYKKQANTTEKSAGWLAFLKRKSDAERQESPQASDSSSAPNHTSKPLSRKVQVLIGIYAASFLLSIILGLGYAGTVALLGFAVAMTLWITTKLPAGFVAISVLAAMIFLRATPAETLYQSFSESVVWLMLGAFVIGEAVKESGLATRLSTQLIERSRGKRGMSRGISLLVGASALFIPSTSGRAALSMPLVKQIGHVFTKPEKEALAMLIPVIILMSTSATLIGAGSHLIGVGLLEATAGQSISFIQWLIWGLPFAAVISIISLWVIHRFFWPNEIEEPELETLIRSRGETTERAPLSSKEKKALYTIGALIIGWITEPIHGYDIAFITVLGALVLMLPTYGIVTWKQGVKAVSWNLLLFVAAATALGRVLVDTGVIAAVEQQVSGLFGLVTSVPEWMIVLLVLLISVTSHIYITSHTTRAVVFIPTFIVFGQTIGADLSALVFLSLVGMNYCVTFPVSSKALLLFYEEGEISFQAERLLKLSMILMPIYIAVMMLFYATYWSWTGLSLFG